MDALDLARIQFAANISFHILFPTITIALGWVLLFFKLKFNATGDVAWSQAYQFFVKIFALSFGLGVVSGLVMSFQFGTNWPGFMETVGNIAGPLLAYEVITAFFLEAAFIGIMLFGQGRVSNRIHTLATVLVAIGTTISAFWILVLNSWMQTPAGFEMIDGVAHATDWMAIVFNPSMPYRLAHMLLASGLTAAFLVAGLSALRWLLNDRGRDVRKALRTGVFLAAGLIPLQILAGDMHGLNTMEHQPQKVAAMEGAWETQQGAPLILFAIPNEAEGRNDFEIGIPNLASLILTHDLDGEVQGLNAFDHAPPMTPIFFAFRVMVGIGVLMLLASFWCALPLARGRDFTPWRARALVAMTFSGWIATLAGWYVTEIGRQPWLVSGVLKTADAAAAHPVATLTASLSAYLLLYAVLLFAYILTLTQMARKAAGVGGPKAAHGGGPAQGLIVPAHDKSD